MTADPAGTLTEVAACASAACPAQKNQRRLAGVSRRIDPRIDARAGNRPACVPREGSGDASVFFRPRDEGCGHGCEHHRATQGKAILLRNARRRRCDAGHREGRRQPLAMQFPQRPCRGVAGVEQAIVGGRERPVRQPGIAIEALERRRAIRPANPDRSGERADERSPEHHQTDDVTPGRQVQPQRQAMTRQRTG